MTKQKKIGTQGLVLPGAYQIGLQCPVGREIDLVIGLERLWPGLNSEPLARDELLRGLAARFGEQKPDGD